MADIYKIFANQVDSHFETVPFNVFYIARLVLWFALTTRDATEIICPSLIQVITNFTLLYGYSVLLSLQYDPPNKIWKSCSIGKEVSIQVVCNTGSTDRPPVLNIYLLFKTTFFTDMDGLYRGNKL